MSLDQPNGEVKPQKVTDDAFLGGRLCLLQPENGFRAGLDSVLLGAAVAKNTASLLDLGAGVGTAGLVALCRAQKAGALLAEIATELVELARANIERNHLADRASVVQIDVAAPGKRREAAGLLPDRFASVIANPPFFDAQGGTAAPDAARARARAMPLAGLERWIRTAVAAAAPGGEVIFIHRTQDLPQLVAGFSARLGALSVLPVAPRPGAPATRILIRGKKGSRAPLTLLPPLVLHGPGGNRFAPPVAAILQGETGLDW